MKKALLFLLILIPILANATEYRVMNVYQKIKVDTPYNTYVLNGNKLQKFDDSSLFLIPANPQRGTFEVSLEQVDSSVIWNIIGTDLYVEFSDGVLSPSYITVNRYKKCKLIIESSISGGILGIGKLIVE